MYLFNYFQFSSAKAAASNKVRLYGARVRTATSRPRSTSHFARARARDLDTLIKDFASTSAGYVANNSHTGAAVDFGTDHRRRPLDCSVTCDDEEFKRPRLPQGIFSRGYVPGS